MKVLVLVLQDLLVLKSTPPMSQVRMTTVLPASLSSSSPRIRTTPVIHKNEHYVLDILVDVIRRSVRQIQIGNRISQG